MKIEHRGASSEYLNCLDAVLITILKAMGLRDEASLLGRRGFFVVPAEGLEISPRIHPVEREWADCLDLVHRPLPTAAELDEAIDDALGRGLPVCLSVDLYSWPHTPHFEQRRQRHYVAIFGAEGTQYHVLCPYYGFEGPVPRQQLHTSYRSSGSGLEGLLTVERLSPVTPSVEEVEALARQSCEYMLGSAMPQGMEDVDPRLLGRAGIVTFASRLETLIETHGENLHEIDGLADLSRRLMDVGYSRHWLSRLLSAHGVGLLPGKNRLHHRWSEVVQAWIAVGKRLAMGLYGRRDAMIAQSLRRVAQLADMETALFTGLQQALTQRRDAVVLPPLSEDAEPPAMPVPGEALWPARPPYDAPRSPEEQRIAAAFAEILALREVGRDDNFFQLGGDSVLLIRLMAKVREDFGVTIGLHTVFETPSVAELADRLAGELAGSAVAPAETAADAAVGSPAAGAPAAGTPAAGYGPLPLTPSQEGCLARPRPFLHHRNIARFFELRREVSDGVLTAALAAVLRHHPALRARFEERDGRWVQYVEPAGDVPFTTVDLRRLPASQHRAAMEEAAAGLQPGFRLDRTPLLRFVRFARGPGQRDRFFALFHHVLVDGYSCDLVFDDLRRACEQLERGEAVQLVPEKTSFRTWVERLCAHASSPEITAQLDTWLAMPFSRLQPLPADHPQGRDVYGVVARISRHWEAAASRRLTGPVAAALGVTVGEIFAAGLMRTLADWSGHHVQAIHEFHHGRMPYFDPQLDVSRTVGYFSYSYPVVAEVPSGGDPSGGEPSGGDPLADVRYVTAQKRRLRHDGLGYSLLRFLHPDPQIRAAMKRLPLPQVRLNYRGRVGRDTPETDSLLRLSDENPGPIMPFSHPRGSLVLTVRIADDRLHMVWQYSHSRHQRSTIEGLATRLDDFLRALGDRVDEQRGGEPE